MKVYLRQDAEKQFASVNFFTAYDGFRKMGWEIQGFDRGFDFADLEADNVVVGYINDIYRALNKLKIDIPPEINYPEELKGFLGRKIWKSRMNFIASHPELWPVFVKPAQHAKKFTGRAIRSTKDLMSCGDEYEDTEIWCAEVVNFIAEWRCFVRYGKIIDIRKYAGDWRAHFDPKIVDRAINSYTTSPNAYAIDFGLTDRGETLLIEANNGYSLGCYGLASHDYAKFLAARWAEITETEDYCAFDL
jgi:hypothetical protein